MAKKVRREEGIRVETLNKFKERVGERERGRDTEREKEGERELGIHEVLRKEEKEEKLRLSDKSSPYISD